MAPEALQQDWPVTEVSHPALVQNEGQAIAQEAWQSQGVRQRLPVLSRWRHAVSEQTEAFCRAISAAPGRTDADVLVTEVLPILAACQFLEENAEKLLRPRHLGRSGRPFWVGKVQSEIVRVALGRVLIIGPSNYPLFLPGVQVLQAIAAGNAVTWKPGRGGQEVAKLFAKIMTDAGLPRGLLRLTDDSDEAGIAAVAAGADKVFFTGSSVAGGKVMGALAKTATPCVMELSDSSAVIVLPTADLDRVIAALVFGMRLNGSATCMAPRRLFLVGSSTARRDDLVERLRAEFERVPPALLDLSVSDLLQELVEDARRKGARVLGEVDADAAIGGRGQRPVLVVGASSNMRVTQTDIFAPVLSMMDVTDTEAILSAQNDCPYGLTVSIFGDEATARRLTGRLRVGTVVINDLIAPTADPRIPFGGRRGSGFGVTRGAEGLLEMTAVKTVLVQRSTSQRHYEATGDTHGELFRGVIQAGHARSWKLRWLGLRQLIQAARKMNARNSNEQRGLRGKA